MLINIVSRQLAALHRYFSATGQYSLIIILSILGNYERDRYNCRILFVKYRVMTSCASHLISHSTFLWLYSEQRVEIELLLHIMVSSDHHHF